MVSNKRRKRIVGGLASLVLVAGCKASNSFEQPSTEIRLVYRTLEHYYHDIGSFPIHPAGSDYSLYILKEYLLTHSGGLGKHASLLAAKWDPVERKAVSARYLLNPDLQHANLSDTRVVLIAKAHVDGYRPAITSDGSIIWLDKSVPPKVAFSAWRTSDEFLIVGRELFDQWEAIPFPRSGPTSTISNGKRTHRIRKGDNELRFRYDERGLTHRTLNMPGRTIEDTVALNEHGMIVSFRREAKPRK